MSDSIATVYIARSSDKPHSTHYSVRTPVGLIGYTEAISIRAVLQDIKDAIDNKTKFRTASEFRYDPYDGYFKINVEPKPTSVIRTREFHEALKGLGLDIRSGDRVSVVYTDPSYTTANLQVRRNIGTLGEELTRYEIRD